MRQSRTCGGTRVQGHGEARVWAGVLLALAWSALPAPARAQMEFSLEETEQAPAEEEPSEGAEQAPAEGEEVATLLAVRDLTEPGDLVFATRRGTVKRTPLVEYQHLNSAGLIAIHLQAGDDLIAVATARPGSDVVLATRGGKAIRFALAEIRPTGRASQGVRGIRLKDGDRVVSLAVIPESWEGDLLAVGSRGYGKRTAAGEYPRQGRGGQGVIGFKTGPKVGELVALLPVEGNEDLLVLSRRGQAIRTRIASIPTYSRATSGVKLMNLPEGDEVVSAFVVVED